MFHKAKKSLGQNFLHAPQVITKMVLEAGIGIGDMVLEIGPGKGVLTAGLLEAGAHVIAVEKDRDLIALLREKFTDAIGKGQLQLVEDDILKFDPKEYKLRAAQYKIVANIPYNITGAIIERFLADVTAPSRMILLVQKEVAARISATNGKESILSLSVKAFGIPKRIMNVGARYFRPEPKVDSAVIAITEISKKNFKKTGDEKKFFTLVKQGFAHKRKLLIGNLSGSAMSREKLADVFKKLSIPISARAENLKLAQWLALARALS